MGIRLFALRFSVDGNSLYHTCMLGAGARRDQYVTWQRYNH
jgi:hypothetical protein